MLTGRSPLALGWLATVAAAWLLSGRPAQAYIDGAPATLGGLCAASTHITLVQVEKLSADKRVVLYRKLADLKGVYPKDTIRHVIGPSHGPNTELLQPTQVGKKAVIFSYNYGKAYDNYGGPEAKGGLVRSYTYIDKRAYICYVGNLDGGRCDDPRLLVQKFYCSPGRLSAAVREILLGKEIVIPCLINDPQGRPTIQRLRAGMRQLDYNPKRDFVGWGDDEFARLYGMPGFSYRMALPNLGGGAQGVSVVDLDGNGGAHLCLFGINRAEVLRNVGDALVPTTIPGLTEGCRAAVWADYNGDGKPDLLLATPAGPRLYTNVGNGTFRDDTARLPNEPGCVTAAAWIDYDGDGRPDLVLVKGFLGLRLYRNLGLEEPIAAPAPQPPKSPAVRWFEDVSVQVGFGPEGIGSNVRGDTVTVCDVNGDGHPDLLYGAGTGMLLLNTPRGFVEAKDCGIHYQPGKVAPVFADFNNSGAMSLFVPQLDGRCKLFKNDGSGRFTDVTARAGDLAKPIGMATCAACADVDGDGYPDIVVGCLRGPNRFFRNRGDGTFEDATAAIGLERRIYNTQGIALADLNNDGILDLVFVNEGQDSVVLLGDVTLPRRRTPVTVTVTGNRGVTGSRVRVLGRDGKLLGLREASGGEGRGGQQGPNLHFALAPGTYQVEARSSAGVIRSREISVDSEPIRVVIGER